MQFTVVGDNRSVDSEEVQLARDLMDGRMEAFDRFVEIFRTRIFQYSYLMCGHREDAEEVAQDALLNAFENFGSLREPEHVRPWMFRIARNACLMKRRKSVFGIGGAVLASLNRPTTGSASSALSLCELELFTSKFLRPQGVRQS